jgi:regulator of protease activity HflC (stomatin/prohibitin superfamily)
MKVDLWPVDGSMPRTRAPSKWRRFFESHLPSVVIYLMVATLVAVVLYPHMVVTVPSGEVGVLWKRFGGGTVLDPRKLKNEGFNLILPWNRVFLYDLRLQSFTESYNAISSDGVSLTAAVIVRFRLQRDAVPVLHQAIGSQGISDSYLRWRGIEATLQLSQSTNAKTVIIGNGKDGLPVIRGAPAPPAGNTTHGDDKERTTAASPARSTTP